MLYSASSAQSQYDTGYVSSTKYLQKQAISAALGLVCMYVCSRIPAQLWLKVAWPLYAVSIVLLLMVLFVGESVNGARRWIYSGGIQLQPAEIAKFMYVTQCQVVQPRILHLLGSQRSIGRIALQRITVQNTDLPAIFAICMEILKQGRAVHGFITRAVNGAI